MQPEEHPFPQRPWGRPKLLTSPAICRPGLQAVTETPGQGHRLLTEEDSARGPGSVRTSVTM
ncbi:rCG30622 [Rattus norvegicus]|uniref:RCG30622 n=1 Tax=Rattus norvegicus TaxID=10116 RepID=A6ITE5_RAT|nr:rCG30622 [Rattus norvegicus]